MFNNNLSRPVEANDDNDDSELRQSISPDCRTQQSTPSPNCSFVSFPASRFSIRSATSRSPTSSSPSFMSWLGDLLHPRKTSRKRKTWYRRRAVAGLVLLVAFILVLNSWMLYRIQDSARISGMEVKFLKMNSSRLSIREELEKLGKGKRPQKTIYARLLSKAAHALAEGQSKPEPKDLWDEPYHHASFWKPCADQLELETSGLSLSNPREIMVT